MAAQRAVPENRILLTGGSIYFCPCVKPDRFTEASAPGGM